MHPCVLLASLILAPNPVLPAWDDVLVTQPYPGWYSAGIPCESTPGYMLAEDCYPSVDFVPYQVDLWLGFNPPGSVEEYNFGFQLDQSGEPEGMFFWLGTEDDVVYQDIGLSVWGLDFFHVIVNIQDPPVLPAGQPCWFCFQAVSSSTVGCLVRNNISSWNSQCFFSLDNGESWQSSTSTWGAPYGVFMIVSGATGLDRCSWGSIKGSFR